MAEHGVAVEHGTAIMHGLAKERFKSATNIYRNFHCPLQCAKKRLVVPLRTKNSNFLSKLAAPKDADVFHYSHIYYCASIKQKYWQA